MNKRQKLPFHTNGMRFTAFDADGDGDRHARLLLGRRRLRGQPGRSGGRPHRRRHHRAALSVPQRRRTAGAGRTHRADDRATDVRQRTRLAQRRRRSATACANSGTRCRRACSAASARSGTLPGGLHVQRRAPALFNELYVAPRSGDARSAHRARLGEPVCARGERRERRRRPRGHRADQRRGRHHPVGAALLRPLLPGRERAGHLRFPADRRGDRHPLQGKRLDQRRRSRLPGRSRRGLLDGRRGPDRGAGRHAGPDRERGRDRHGAQPRPDLRSDRRPGADPLHRTQRDGRGEGDQRLAHGAARRRQAQGLARQGHQDHARHRAATCRTSTRKPRAAASR